MLGRAHSDVQHIGAYCGQGKHAYVFARATLLGSFSRSSSISSTSTGLRLHGCGVLRALWLLLAVRNAKHLAILRQWRYGDDSSSSSEQEEANLQQEGGKEVMN